jgi:hypothetical protein
MLEKVGIGWGRDCLGFAWLRVVWCGPCSEDGGRPRVSNGGSSVVMLILSSIRRGLRVWFGWMELLGITTNVNCSRRVGWSTWRGWVGEALNINRPLRRNAAPHCEMINTADTNHASMLEMDTVGSSPHRQAKTYWSRSWSVKFLRRRRTSENWAAAAWSMSSM